MKKHLFVKAAGMVGMAVILICVSSCLRKKSIFPHEVCEFSFNESDRTITGVPTGLQYEGFIEESILIDSLLICQVEEPEGYVNVYRLKDLSLKATLCPLGRSRNEFHEPLELRTQYYKKGGDTYILVVDKMNIIKEINLTQSLAQGTTVVTDMADTPSFYQNKEVLYIDNDIRQLFMSDCMEQSAFEEYGVQYRTVDMVKKDTVQLHLLSKPMKKDEESVTYYSYGPVIKHPQKNLFAQPCSYMDYVIFFDIDNDKIFAAHREGKPTFDDLAPDGRSLIFSRFACVSDDYLFTEYLKDEDGQEREKFLLVFDWAGNLKASARFGNDVFSFVYDEKQNVLYGWNDFRPEEKPYQELYKFDLNGILEK